LGLRKVAYSTSNVGVGKRHALSSTWVAGVNRHQRSPRMSRFLRRAHWRTRMRGGLLYSILSAGCESRPLDCSEGTQSVLRTKSRCGSLARRFCPLASCPLPHSPHDFPWRIPAFWQFTPKTRRRQGSRRILLLPFCLCAFASSWCPLPPLDSTLACQGAVRWDQMVARLRLRLRRGGLRERSPDVFFEVVCWPRSS